MDIECILCRTHIRVRGFVDEVCPATGGDHIHAIFGIAPDVFTELTVFGLMSVVALDAIFALLHIVSSAIFRLDGRHVLSRLREGKLGEFFLHRSHGTCRTEVIVFDFLLKILFRILLVEDAIFFLSQVDAEETVTTTDAIEKERTIRAIGAVAAPPEILRVVTVVDLIAKATFVRE